MRRSIHTAALACALILGAIAMAPVASADPAPGEPDAVAAHASRLAGDEERTRFVVDLDHHLDFHVFALTDPYRVVIDLPQTEFSFEDGAGRSGRGLVSAYRYGRFAPGKSRIVLDVTGPVKVDRAFTLEAEDGQPARLVVDLIGTDRDSMLATIETPPTSDDTQPARPDPHGHTAVPPGGGRSSDDIVVVIDPGHGGIDPGAISQSGVKEKDIVLAFARRLQEALTEKGPLKVHMTRDEDVFVSLTDRVHFGRDKRASLFISIHADSVARGEVSGASVYTLSDRASDAVAAQLAAKENRSDALAGLDLSEEVDGVADILLDLVHRETKQHSVFFARTLIENLRDEVTLVRNPLRSAGFRVLEAHDVPSVLIELGYLTSSEDEQLLTDEEWQETVAGRVADAVIVYFGERHARGPL